MARLPADHKFLSNFAHTTLGVAEAMLDGEVEYHRGNYEQAYACLREAVHRDDSLNYSEPWAWMHPPRHALAALLMEQGHYAEAETIYRDDLGLSGRVQRGTQHPDNVWSLHGLVECLQRRGATEELRALEAKLAAAMAKVDVPITSSCMCRTKIYQPREFSARRHEDMSPLLGSDPINHDHLFPRPRRSPPSVCTERHGGGRSI